MRCNLEVVKTNRVTILIIKVKCVLWYGRIYNVSWWNDICWYIPIFFKALKLQFFMSCFLQKKISLYWFNKKLSCDTSITLCDYFQKVLDYTMIIDHTMLLYFSDVAFSISQRSPIQYLCHFQVATQHYLQMLTNCVFDNLVINLRTWHF